MGLRPPSYWNSAFTRLATCYELRLQIDVAVTSIEGAGAPELDRFHLVYPYLRRGRARFPMAGGCPPSSIRGVRAADLAGEVDTPYPFDQVAVGYLPEWLFEDSWAMAHELGHFVGLGEDYKDGGIIPGREGTLMGGTEGADYINQTLVDDVAKLLEDAGYDLPECISGKFLLHMSSHSVAEFQDHDTEHELNVTFFLKPKEDGSLEGTGTAEFLPPRMM